MFEGFDAKGPSRDDRRLRISLVVSTILYVGLGAAVVVASAAARSVRNEEDLVQVVIAAPPEPPPPVEPPATPPPAHATVVGVARPKAQRPTLEDPKEIPDEKPAESAAALVDAPAADQGQTGFLDGVLGGTGTVAGAGLPPPAPKVAPAKPVPPTPPVPKAGNRLPVYPRVARQEGIEGQVVAKVLVRADGTVAKVQVLSGPEIFHEPVIEALMSYRYQPARLPNGTAIAVYHVVTFPFSLKNAG